MKKLITLSLLLFSFIGFSQTEIDLKKPVELTQPLNRFLYERYFKSLYKYEPFMIRENKIAYLEVKKTEKIADSVISSKIIEKVFFRKDGRPIQIITWKNDLQDSSIADFSYDSSGNLVEYRLWIINNYNHVWEIDLAHQLFQYKDQQLTKIVSHSMPDGNYYKATHFCDSLSYDLNKHQVSIIQCKSTESEILYRQNTYDIHPIDISSSITYSFKEEAILDKPLDDENIWTKADCVYNDSVLLELQFLTRRKCLNYDIVNAGNGLSTFDDFVLANEKLKLTFDSTTFYKTENVIFVDTVVQIIYVKQNFRSVQATSLENEHTTTSLIKRYDYSTRLMHVESVREHGRGPDHGKDSSQTVYTFYSFGLMQKKLEIRYSKYHYGRIYGSSTDVTLFQKNDYSPAMIYEEEIEIKRWEGN